MTKKEIQQELSDMGIYWTPNGSIKELSKAELYQILCEAKNSAVLRLVRDTANRVIKENKKL